MNPGGEPHREVDSCYLGRLGAWVDGLGAKYQPGVSRSLSGAFLPPCPALPCQPSGLSRGSPNGFGRALVEPAPPPPKGNGPAEGSGGAHGPPMDPKFPARSPNFLNCQAHTPWTSTPTKNTDSPAHPSCCTRPGSQDTTSDRRQAGRHLQHNQQRTNIDTSFLPPPRLPGTHPRKLRFKNPSRSEIE